MLFGQVRLGVFSGAVEIFSGKDGSALLEKIGPYAYAWIFNRPPWTLARDNQYTGWSSPLADLLRRWFFIEIGWLIEPG